MKVVAVFAVLLLTSTSVLAEKTCRKDSWGTTRCSDGTTYETDLDGTVRDNKGNSCRKDSWGTTRCSDGTTYETGRDGTVRDNKGNTWRTDMFGTTRGSDGSVCRKDMFDTLRCE